TRDAHRASDTAARAKRKRRGRERGRCRRRGLRGFRRGPLARSDEADVLVQLRLLPIRGRCDEPRQDDRAAPHLVLAGAQGHGRAAAHPPGSSDAGIVLGLVDVVGVRHTGDTPEQRTARVRPDRRALVLGRRTVQRRALIGMCYLGGRRRSISSRCSLRWIARDRLNGGFPFARIFASIVSLSALTLPSASSASRSASCAAIRGGSARQRGFAESLAASVSSGLYTA